LFFKKKKYYRSRKINHRRLSASFWSYNKCRILAFHGNEPGFAMRLGISIATTAAPAVEILIEPGAVKKSVFL